MTRIAQFTADPTSEKARECTDASCNAEHFALEVRGAHSVERFSCTHLVNTVVWHELTPAEVKNPVCDKGCALEVEIVG